MGASLPPPWASSPRLALTAPNISFSASPASRKEGEERKIMPEDVFDDVKVDTNWII